MSSWPLVLCIVDDHVDDVVDQLRDEGLDGSEFDVHTATNRKDGLSLIMTERPDVAVIDLFLPENGETSDQLRCTDPKVGEALLRDIGEFNRIAGFEIQTVLITAYAESVGRAIDGIMPAPVVIEKNGKGTYVGRLLETLLRIGSELRRHGPCGFYNRHLEVEYKGGVDEFDDEAEELICKLLPDASCAEVFPVIPGLSDASVYCVEWESAVTETFGRPHLLKVSRNCRDVQIEVSKFYGFVKGQMDREYYLDISRPSSAGDCYRAGSYCGFLASFGEARRETLQDLSRAFSNLDKPLDFVAGLLKTLFVDCLDTWQEWRVAPEAIGEYYRNLRVNDEPFIDLDACQDRFADLAQLMGHGAGASWIEQEGKGQVEILSPTAIVGRVCPGPRIQIYQRLGHGDLHGRNVLVGDTDSRIRLIDFPMVQEYHALFDTARLESYVVVEVLPRISLKNFAKLMDALASQPSLEEEISDVRLGSSKRARRAFGIVKLIRKASSEFSCSKRLTEYLYALLFHLLAHYQLPHLSTWQLKRVAVATSLVARTLGRR